MTSQTVINAVSYLVPLLIIWASGFVGAAIIFRKEATSSQRKVMNAAKEAVYKIPKHKTKEMAGALFVWGSVLRAYGEVNGDIELAETSKLGSDIDSALEADITEHLNIPSILIALTPSSNKILPS